MANLKFNLKDFSTRKTVSTFKLEHDQMDNSTYGQLTALAVLLGGYNAFGRRMDVKRFHELEDKFAEIVNEIADSI